MKRTLQGLVDLAGNFGRFTPKHPFPMKTTFRNCFLVNFSMEPKVLKRALPLGLEPDVYKDKAFLSVVVADLEAMRIGFLPRFLGSNFTQVVYRAIVRAPNGERGVYFVRSDADSTWMSLTGNLFSNFNFNLADIQWKGREQLPWSGPGSLDDRENLLTRPENVKWLPNSAPNHRHRSEAKDNIQVAFSLDPWIKDEPARIQATYDFSTASLTMPSYSHFAGIHVGEAQKFFVELYAAFMSWPNLRTPCWTAVHIDRTRWNVTSIDHLSSSNQQQSIYEFMQSSSLFQPGDCKLDSCFYVHDLDYHWHIIEKYPLQVLE